MKPPAITISFTVAEARFIVELADRLRGHAGIPAADDLIGRIARFIEERPGSNNADLAAAFGLKAVSIRNHFAPKLKARGFRCSRGRFAHWWKTEANRTNGNSAIGAIEGHNNRETMKSTAARCG
jgi:hypothetical protein